MGKEFAQMYEQLSPENRAKVEAETVRLLERQNDPLSLHRTERKLGKAGKA